MKNLALITCLFFLAAHLYSQTYTPFLTTDSTVWRVNFYNCDGPWECTGYEEFDFMIGDTILNGQLYTRLYRNHNGLSWDTSSPMGYIREEDKRIYYVRYNYDYDTLLNETILYDFNLSIGDTMHWDTDILNFDDYESYGIVNQIDSVQINNGEYRRQFWLNSMSPVNIRIIEGIGSNFGLFRPNYSPFESIFEVLCVSDESTLIYDSGIRYYADADACLYIPVSTEQPLPADLKIFPNPAHNTLYFSQNIPETRLEIYTPIGIKVFETENFTGTQLDISHLSSGMYFMVLGSTQKTAVKVVKN